MYSFLFFVGFVCSYSLLIRNSHLIGSPVFVFAKSGKPALLGPRPVSQPSAHRRRERPARCSHAGRSLATRPQREPGRRNLSTCLINGGAETAVQTGLRQPHKEEAPRPLPPSIDPGPLWLGQRGRGRRLAGTWPFSLGGEGPWRTPAPPAHPTVPPPAGSRSEVWGCPRPLWSTGRGTGRCWARPGRVLYSRSLEPASGANHPDPAS